MKIRALGPLSGAVGDRKKNEEFEVSKEVGEGLILRGYAEEVTERPGKISKPEPARE